MADLIRKSFPAETKAIDADQGMVEAIVNCTAIEDFQKDYMEPGAWDMVIKSAHSGDTEWPSLVWGHQWEVTTGKVLTAEELRPGDARLKGIKGSKGAGGLRIVAQYNLETQRGREAFSDVKFGAVKQWSVGFLTAPDGEFFDNKGVRHVTKVGVWPEVSNVLVGASPGTYTAIVKSLELSEDRAQRSADRILQAGAITEEWAVLKDLPQMTGSEAVHNKPFGDAMAAIKTLIQQELAEDEPEFDCVNRLSAIGLQLISWANDEMNEYSDYATMTMPMTDVIQAGVKALTLKEEAPVEETPEAIVPPEPDADAFDLKDPDSWPDWIVTFINRELAASTQPSDPEHSDDEVLTHFGRHNTRTGQDRLG